MVKNHRVDVTTARVDGHGQCPTDEFGAHVVLHGVTNESTRSQIEHAGEVEPPFVGSDVGDVPAGAPSRDTDAEVALHEVRQRWRPQIRNRRANLFAPRVNGVEAVVAHEAFDALVVDDEASFRQFVDQPRRTVGIVEVVVNDADLVHQVGLVEITLARSFVVVSPLVVTRR